MSLAVGDKIGFVCNHCGAAHKEKPLVARLHAAYDKPADLAPVAAAIEKMESHYAKLAKLNASNRIGDALPFAHDNYNAAFEKAGAAAIAYCRALIALAPGGDK